jgi:DedD protein
MEDRTLRDVERWKDKIEIRLDNRQVFFLFFGSALVACLLFILGVVVGKRLESRGRAAAPEIEDPLALLDRIAASPGTVDESITFPRTLIQAPVVRADKKLPKGEAKPVVSEPTEQPPVTAQAADKIKQVESAPVPTAAAAPPIAAVAPKVVIAAAAVPVKKVEAKVAPDTKAEDKKSAVSKSVPAASSGPAKFSLQLGSFQSREEADAFMSEFLTASPVMVTSDIPGKGRWFRVRVGKFSTNEEAVKAKAEFERQHLKIAYIAPL